MAAETSAAAAVVADSKYGATRKEDGQSAAKTDAVPPLLLAPPVCCVLCNKPAAHGAPLTRIECGSSAEKHPLYLHATCIQCPSCGPAPSESKQKQAQAKKQAADALEAARARTDAETKTNQLMGRFAAVPAYTEEQTRAFMTAQKSVSNIAAHPSTPKRMVLAAIATPSTPAKSTKKAQ